MPTVQEPTCRHAATDEHIAARIIEFMRLNHLNLTVDDVRAAQEFRRPGVGG
jgi:hypothetical protein